MDINFNDIQNKPTREMVWLSTFLEAHSKSANNRQDALRVADFCLEEFDKKFPTQKFPNNV